MLDVAPEIEKTVRDYAAREGVSIDELLARTFTARTLSQASDGKPVLSDDNAFWETFRAQIEEAKNATPEEIAEADAEYLLWQQNMDAPRRANGERLLFPDVPPLP